MPTELRALAIATVDRLPPVEQEELWLRVIAEVAKGTTVTIVRPLQRVA